MKTKKKYPASPAPLPIFRQGDVLLMRLPELPSEAVMVAPSGPRVILAYGEATGHHHSLAASSARLHTVPGTKPGTQATILEVADALAELVHQEHAPIPLERGAYAVVLQREYHPQEIRRVAD